MHNLIGFNHYKCVANCEKIKSHKVNCEIINITMNKLISFYF